MASRGILLRAILLTACVAAAAAAVLLLTLRDTRGALASALIAAGAGLLVGPQRGPGGVSPRQGWLAFAAIAAGVAVLAYPVEAMLALLAAFAIKLFGNWKMQRSLPGAEFEMSSAGEMARGATDTIAQFAAAGFEHVGGYRIRAMRRPIAVAVMIGPLHDRFALVTDLVCQVVSPFGGRWLVTSNSGLAPELPRILRQQVNGPPSALIDAHQAALDLLERRRIRPDRLENGASAVEAAIAVERCGVEGLAGAPLTTLITMEFAGAPKGRLDRDSRGTTRLDQWVAAGA